MRLDERFADDHQEDKQDQNGAGRGHEISELHVVSPPLCSYRMNNCVDGIDECGGTSRLNLSDVETFTNP